MFSNLSAIFFLSVYLWGGGVFKLEDKTRYTHPYISLCRNWFSSVQINHLWGSVRNCCVPKKIGGKILKPWLIIKLLECMWSVVLNADSEMVIELEEMKQKAYIHCINTYKHWDLTHIHCIKTYKHWDLTFWFPPQSVVRSVDQVLTLWL